MENTRKNKIFNKIFIVEDDENIRELIIYALKSNGFEAQGFENANDFFSCLENLDVEENNNVSLIILDIMLPEIDGLEILNILRSNSNAKYNNFNRFASIPVIILSAKSSEVDKIRGLNSGADDYLSKPFGVLELISRINAVLRRSERSEKNINNNCSVNETANVIVYKNIKIDKDKRAVYAGDLKIELTYKEYELLCYLALNSEIVISRDKIIENIWGYDFEGASRTVDMHIKTLRQKLGEAGSHIKTVRGVGYKIGE